MNQANRRESALTFLRPDDCVARFADEQPRRIHIIGTSGGAGKTTLARRMGVSLEIPVHDLDAIAYEGASEGRPGVKRPIEDRLRDISFILRQPAWMTEGCYLWWINELLEQAELIVWLDLHWSVAAWRVVKREARRWRAGEKMHGGILEYINFLWDQRSDYLSKTPGTPTAQDDDSAISRAGTLTELSRYAVKTARCARPGDVETVVESLNRGQG